MAAALFAPTPPTAADTIEAAGRFKALGDPSRLRILSILADVPDVSTVMSASAICDALVERGWGLTQPTVSHHLRILEKAGFVVVDRPPGIYVYHRLNVAGLAEVADAMTPPPR